MRINPFKTPRSRLAKLMRSATRRLPLQIRAAKRSSARRPAKRSQETNLELPRPTRGPSIWVKSKGPVVFPPPRLMSPWIAALAGMGTGALLMYVFDPDRGRRRRALARDKTIHAMHQERDFLGKAARDMRHRSIGLFARLRHLASDTPPDDILIERVRSRVGRYVTHPSSIEVDATDGKVTLRGPILSSEVDRLLRGVGRVQGVHSVEDDLEAHEHGENVPGLQGRGFASGPLISREAWPPAYRLAAMGVGLGAGVAGSARGGMGGSLLAAAGGMLALRAASNLPLRRFFGIGAGHRGIDVQKTITVHRPIAEVFQFWTQPQNFPRFMEHVKQVTSGSDQDTTHWKVEGPGGTTVSFDAEVTTLEPNRRFGWKTKEGAMVRHAGIVHFLENGPNSTRVHLQMTYQPPAGTFGHAVAVLFRKDPKHALDRDLQRMKSLLEDGEAKAHGETIRVEELH